MPATYLPPRAAARFFSFSRALLLLAASSLVSPTAFAQVASGPSPAAAAANADRLAWMMHGLLTAVVGLAVLTGLVLLIAFTTRRRPDARPLAPTPAAPRPEAVTA